MNRYGLTTEEATARYLKFGPNEVVPSRLRSRLSEIQKILLDPMGLMLLGLSGIYALIGNRTDAIVLIVAYVPVTAVDVILELKASRALRALQATLQLKAKVIRDGKSCEIPVQRLVPGDVLLFEEGQTLPADGRVIESHRISINESALTGESVPVEKVEFSEFFAGTTLLQGRGLGLIEYTGGSTRFGKIAELLEETVEQKSPLQKKVHELIRRVVVVALALALVLFVIECVRGVSLLQSLVIAATFGMAAIPEEFPIVFTLYLSVGAWRLSRHGVLVKSLPSVETLGSVDVICTDKTGTLTEGRFQLEELWLIDGSLPSEMSWSVALMACEEKPTDAMESGVFRKAEPYLAALDGWQLRYDYPFEMAGKHMSHVWVKTATGQMRIAMKGAVEGVLEHCAIDSPTKTRLFERANELARRGKRLLGLAYRDGECTGRREDDEAHLQFLGLLVYSDPLRATAKAAIVECQKAGIQIKMLTGDHPLTAHAIADQAGILHSHQYLFSGDELARLAPHDRRLAYQRGAVFSRVLPEQKYEMVEALKADGNVVAMTGDGINDAPALKLADIGISMGENATDVARSAAQMILMKNDFNGIVQAVFEGRKIFSNLKRSFSYLIAFHIPILVLALVPPLFGWGDLFLPIHIVLLELIVHPVSAFAFENLPIEGDRNIRQAFSPRRFVGPMVSGLMLSLVALFVARTAYRFGAGGELPRTAALMTVLFGNLFFVLAESFPRITFRVIAIAAGFATFVAMVLHMEKLRSFFHLTELSRSPLALAIVGAALSAVPMWALRHRFSLSLK